MVDIRQNSEIIFSEDSVTKKFPSETALELEKSQMLWEIGSKYGFKYPKPLEHDLSTETIIFERLHTKGSIRQDYLDFMTSPDLNDNARLVFEKAGRALGAIHKELSLTKKHQWIPSQDFREAAAKAGCDNLDSLTETLPHAFLHGDYGIENVERISDLGDNLGENANSSDLAVFDASPNYFATHHTNTYGPIYVDIGNFLGVLNGLVSLKHYPFLKWKRAAILQKSFCIGYTETSGIKCDHKAAQLFARATASSYLLKKYKKKYMRNAAMWLLFNPLKGTLLS